jgi:hypothetical protein
MGFGLPGLWRKTVVGCSFDLPTSPSQPFMGGDGRFQGITRQDLPTGQTDSP